MTPRLDRHAHAVGLGDRGGERRALLAGSGLRAVKQVKGAAELLGSGHKPVLQCDDVGAAGEEVGVGQERLVQRQPADDRHARLFHDRRPGAVHVAGVANDGDHLVLLDEYVGILNSGRRVTRVVLDEQLDLVTVKTARGVHRVRPRLRDHGHAAGGRGLAAAVGTDDPDGDRGATAGHVACGRVEVAPVDVGDVEVALLPPAELQAVAVTSMTAAAAPMKYLLLRMLFPGFVAPGIGRESGS